MGIHNLDKIFKPESVAVIGASKVVGSVGRALMENLTQDSFVGKIIPVNPKHTEINGTPSYPSLSAYGKPVDLAVVATPIDTVPGIISECVENGVGGAVIISAGGRETGKEGRKLEDRINKIAREGGLRIIGPNCMGIIRPDINLNASFAQHMPSQGPIAFISQSGAVCSAMLDLSLKENMGFKYFVSIGSMLDVDFGDVIDYLGNDPEVSSILLYVESLTEIRKFMSAARAVSRLKPIIVLKAGKSEAGARAASSHTGALAGEDNIYEAAFKRAGMARVKTLESFFDCAELLGKQDPPSGQRLVVITNAGGPGVMTADAVSEYGLTLWPLEKSIKDRLDRILPVHWSHHNPIDILGDATPDRYLETTTCCFDADNIDGMLIIVNPQAMTQAGEVAEALKKHLKRKPYPILTAVLGGVEVENGRKILNAAGIPTFDTPERAVRSFAVLCEYAENLAQLQEIPSRIPDSSKADEKKAKNILDKGLQRKTGILTEVESKALMNAYGIPVNDTRAAWSKDEASRVANELGYPLVMKILSSDITHKTEVGGVIKNLKNKKEVQMAYERIMASSAESKIEEEIRGVSLQPQIYDAEVELLIGAKKDDQFGPVILFGMGGIFAEVFKDRNIALPPLNETLALRLIEKTTVFKILKGFRNLPKANLILLKRLLVCLSHLLVDFPEIMELDMNPVLLKNGEPVAVDARVKVQPSGTPSPHHLVISPYPEHYEYKEKTNDGKELFIRPIKPEDAPLLLDLFESLSSQSRYHRFFSPLKSLPRDMLIRLTQIDYDRHIGLVAIGTDEGEKKILGVARVIIGPDRSQAEFSVVVGDKWQGKGIGGKLLEKCMTAGKAYNIKHIYGHVLAENRQMLSLGKEMGFEIAPGEERSTFILKKHP